MLYPIIGSLALAAGTVSEKILLKSKKLKIYSYQTLSFLLISLLLIPLLFFFWKMDSPAIETKNIIIFIGIIAISLTANLFTFYSLKWEKVSATESARILEPLLVILLTLIFSFFIDSGLYNKNPKVLLPALIAAAALIFSSVKKHHLSFNKYVLAAIAGSFFFALELVISRLILDYYSPFTFYFFRCFGIFIFSIIILHPKLSDIDNKVKLYSVCIAAIWIVYRIALYYGYIQLGVLFTTLLVMLAPVFVYLFAFIFLKEKPTWRNILASAIIIGCVIWAIF